MSYAFLHAIDSFALSLIVGGGLVMAAAVRPFLLRFLAMREPTDTVATLERISISAWSRFNQIAFASACLLIVTDFIRMMTNVQVSSVHLVLSIAIALCFLRKFAVDKKLSARLHMYGGEVVGSQEQNKGHKEVELLSKIILVMAIFLLVWPI